MAAAGVCVERSLEQDLWCRIAPGLSDNEQVTLPSSHSELQKDFQELRGRRGDHICVCRFHTLYF